MKAENILAHILLLSLQRIVHQIKNPLFIFYATLHYRNVGGCSFREWNLSKRFAFRF